MGVSRTESHDDAAPEPNEQAAVRPDDAPTGQLLTGAVGDRCVNCGAPLAADQRYCVHCGERRGTSRFSAANSSGQTAQPTARGSEPPSQATARRPSYGTTLVAGIATLLLAMGVGVEIGRISNNANSGSRAAAQPQTITVNGGASGASGTGGTGSGSAGTAATGGAAAKTHAGKHTHARRVVVVKTEAKKAAAAAAAPKPTKAAVQKASNAANGVLGGNAGQSNATVTTGGQCAAGSAGCQNGKFTGNFFGGG